MAITVESYRLWLQVGWGHMCGCADWSLACEQPANAASKHY